MSFNISLDGSAAQKTALTQMFVVGGFNIVSFTVPVGGPYFAIPKDPRRKYLGFSVQTGQPDVQLIPGANFGTVGYNITANNLPWEIGGSLMQCLVGLPWLINAAAQSIVNVGWIRDC